MTKKANSNMVENAGKAEFSDEPRFAPGDIRLPKLTCAIDVDKHMRECSGVMTEIMYLEKEAYVSGFQYRATTLFLESVASVPEVYTIASEIASSCTWEELRRTLVNAFCSPQALARERHRMLETIQFKRPYAMFLHECRKLHFLCVKTNKDSDPTMVETVLKKMPAMVQGKVVSKLVSINPYNWQEALPFYSTSDSSFLSIVESVLNTTEILAGLQPEEDSFFSMKEPSGTSKKNANSDWLQDWCKQFKRVCFFRGSGFMEELMRIKQAHDADIEVKIFPKGKTGPYGLMGLKKGVKKCAGAAGALGKCPLPPKEDVDNVKVIGGTSVEVELLIHGMLSIMQMEVNIVAMVDTGAGLCYLIPSEHVYKTLPLTHGKLFRVKVADGREILLRSTLYATLELWDIGKNSVAKSKLELIVFPPEAERDTTMVIMGRQGIRIFGLHIQAGMVSLSNGSRLVNHNLQSQTQPPVRKPISDEDQVKAVMEQESDVERILNVVVHQGWMPLIRAHAYECRLRRKVDEDLADVEGQTHVFEIGVPSPRVTGDTSNIVQQVCGAAKSHYRRLGHDVRHKADAILDEYLSRKFWVEKSEEECRKMAVCGIPTPIFVVLDRHSSSKPRIVCDFQVLNSTIPPAGNDNTQPCYLLAALRLCAPEVISVSDAEKAFYKVRLVRRSDGTPVKLWLVGVSRNEEGELTLRHFLTDRMAFGLSFGPSGLVTTMRTLFHSRPEFKAHIGWYVDDVSQAGSLADVQHDFKLVHQLLLRCGHALQASKTGVIDTSEKIEYPDVGHMVKCFNTKLAYVSEGLMVDCDRQNASRSLKQLSELNLTGTELTKAEWFGLAGSLGYDLLKNHPAESVLADALRSLIGKEFADMGWKTPLPLTRLGERKRRALEIMQQWALELITENPCKHCTPIGPSPDNCRLEIYVDASDIGAGFVIYWRQTVVWQSAWIWRSSEKAWHSNRKEAIVLLAAHQTVVDLLTCVGKTHGNWDLRFFGDNKSALKWSTCSPLDVAKKQERRAIARIIDAIRDEHQVIREYGTITISHVPGPLNGVADQLSRLGNRKRQGSEESLADLLGPEEDANNCRSFIDMLSGHEEDMLGERNRNRSVSVGSYVEPVMWDDSFQLMEVGVPQFLDVVTDSVNHLGERGEYSSCTLGDIPLIEDGGIMNLLERIDFICHVNDSDGRKNSSVHANTSWAELCAQDSYDINAVLHMASVMKWVLTAWRNQVRRIEPEVYPEDWDDEARLAVARSAQNTVTQLPKNLKGEVGPLVLDNRTNAWYYRRALPTAEYVYDLFIPASCPRLQESIIRQAHKKVGHLGVDYTHSHIKGWWLHRGYKVTIQVLRYCLHCQLKNANRKLGPKGEMGLKDTGTIPFHMMALDHLSLGGKITVLTSMCLVTGYSVWMYCKSHNTQDTCNAFYAICARLPRSPDIIYTDAAPVFGQVRADYQRRSGYVLKHQKTASHSQFQNGKLERLHAVGLSILGSRVYMDSLKIAEQSSLTPVDIQRLLDEVCQVLNARPITQIYSDESGNRFPITPNLLVYGLPSGTDSEDASLATRPFVENVRSWVEKFQGLYWSRLKEESVKTLGSKAKQVDFKINEPVLFFMKGSKLGIDFRLGMVRDIVGNYCFLGVRDKVVKVHFHNCVKLVIRTERVRSEFDVTRVGADM